MAYGCSKIGSRNSKPKLPINYLVHSSALYIEIHRKTGRYYVIDLTFDFWLIRFIRIEAVSVVLLSGII